MWLKKNKNQSSENLIQGQVEIHPQASVSKSELKGRIKIGKNCKLKEVVLYGDIIIGHHTSLWGPNIDVHARLNEVSIGNFCSIARNTSIQEYNHITSRCSTYFMTQNFFKEERGMLDDIESKGPISIGSDVWIGTQCVILSGATIGNGAVIAANSVVSGVIPPFAIAGGSPAKVLKYRFSDEIIEKLNLISWWSWSEEKIHKNRELFKGELTIEKLNAII